MVSMIEIEDAMSTYVKHQTYPLAIKMLRSEGEIPARFRSDREHAHSTRPIHDGTGRGHGLYDNSTQHICCR